MSPQHSGSLSTIDSSICSSDFIKMNGYWRSNLTRWSRRGRLRGGQRGEGVASGGGSPQPGVAHAMGHHFLQGLTLRTRRIQGNSPRGSSNGRGDGSRARDGDWVAPTFTDVEDDLQRSAGDEIRLCRGSMTCRWATWCWLGAMGSPTERWWARAVARVSVFLDQNSSQNEHYI
jgi:hypothetical protein